MISILMIAAKGLPLRQRRCDTVFRWIWCSSDDSDLQNNDLHQCLYHPFLSLSPTTINHTHPRGVFWSPLRCLWPPHWRLQKFRMKSWDKSASHMMCNLCKTARHANTDTKKCQYKDIIKQINVSKIMSNSKVQIKYKLHINQHFTNLRSHLVFNVW